MDGMEAAQKQWLKEKAALEEQARAGAEALEAARRQAEEAAGKVGGSGLRLGGWGWPLTAGEAGAGSGALALRVCPIHSSPVPSLAQAATELAALKQAHAKLDNENGANLLK